MARTSNAQKQKEYRDRKKTDPNYLKKESARTRSNYVPRSQLSNKKLLEIRARSRGYDKKHRENKKQATETPMDTAGPCDSTR